jgi:hypothetical protein
MTAPIDLVEQLLRLAIAGQSDEALGLLDEQVDILRRDGSLHRGLDAARRLQRLDAVLAARVADARLTLLVARGDRVAAQAVVTLRPETDGGQVERLEPAWQFTVGGDRITSVSVHTDLASALAAAGIRSARDPGVERRVFGWGVLIRARQAGERLRTALSRSEPRPARAGCSASG